MTSNRGIKSYGEEKFKIVLTARQGSLDMDRNRIRSHIEKV